VFEVGVAGTGWKCNERRHARKVLVMHAVYHTIVHERLVLQALWALLACPGMWSKTWNLEARNRSKEKAPTGGSSVEHWQGRSVEGSWSATFT
jgi:hypothetical protein